MTDPTNPYASAPSGIQPPYGQQPQYGTPQFGNGQAQYGYGQPAYGQPGYAPQSPFKYDGIRTQAIVALVLSCVSWLMFYLLMSVPAMIWAIVLVGQTRAEDVPSDVRSMAKTARLVSIIMVALQAALTVGLIVLVVLSET